MEQHANNNQEDIYEVLHQVQQMLQGLNNLHRTNYTLYSGTQDQTVLIYNSAISTGDLERNIEMLSAALKERKQVIENIASGMVYAKCLVDYSTVTPELYARGLCPVYNKIYQLHSMNVRNFKTGKVRMYKFANLPLEYESNNFQLQFLGFMLS